MTRRMQLDDVDRVAVPAQPAISPDGTTVVYAVTTVDREADELRSALWRVSAAGGEPVPLTRGTADSAPAWSPDGSQLAFLRRAGNALASEGSQPASPRRAGDPAAPGGGQLASPRRADDPAAPGGGQLASPRRAVDPPEAQLWLLPAATGEPRQLTELPAGAGDPVWSPDGSRIAFTAPVDGASGDEHAPVVADRLGYKLDGVGWWREKRRHIFVVDAATGATTQVTRGDWHAGSPAWSPDGRRLAFPAATAPDADLTGESRAFLLDPDTGEQRPVTPPGGLAGPVSWTADGEALLVVGRRDVRPGHEELLRVVALPGGEVTTLAAGLDRNVMPGRPGYPGGLPQLAPDGRTLLFCVRDRGCTHLYALDPGTDTPRPLLGGADRVVSGLSVARHEPRAAVVLASPTSYGEVAVLDVDSGDLTVLTDHSLPDVELLVPEERVFPISGGREVHGWLLRDQTARTPAPLLLDMHGGPHNAWSPVPSPGRPYWQLLAARGWAVLLLNPRGSDGYGEDFYTAAVGSWGVADERDLLEPVDALVGEGVADPDRLALTGYSYGGYLTCWLTGRTDRFRAAVSGGPVADLASMAGTSDMGHLGIRLEVGALPYQDPEQVARQSPFTRVGEVTTPTLLLQGAADDRCPPGQAEQWFAALRGREVPARLVLYPGASHLFLYNGRPSHRRDYSQRLVDWVTRHTRKVPPVDRDRWQRRLTELAERYQVPGAVLGVTAGEERLTAVHGVTNLDTGVAVTPDTLFQIGSITKVLTATAVLRLVEAGRLDLDQPVVGYLPELTLADPEQQQRLTMRHLLTHTSGIDGDFFHDTGRGDDCLARYVAELATQPPNHPLGATFSYCNTGFSLAGRVIEVLTGKVWDEAMRELLFAPLGLARVATLPEEALLHRAAIGHPYDGDGPPYRAPVWGLPRSGGPAGASLATTVDDLLTVARLHLSGGLAPDGTRLLTDGSVGAMQSEQVRLPDKVVWFADSWGLGWNRADWGGTRVVSHTGQTIGQQAFLHLLPEQDLAIALLTNGGHANDLYLELVPALVRELTGLTPPPVLEPPDPSPAVDLAPYAGTYERTGVRYDVWQDGSGPQLRVTSTHEVPGLDRPPQESPLVPVADGLFAVRPPGERIWVPVTFYQLSDGSPYLQLFRRATPKIG